MPIDLSGLDKKQYDRVMDLAAYLKDACIHIAANKYPISEAANTLPPDDAMIFMAKYLIDNKAVDKYESSYGSLRAAVDKALDIEDDAGQKLREFNFTHTGPISILRNILMDAVGAVSCEQPKN